MKKWCFILLIAAFLTLFLSVAASLLAKHQALSSNTRDLFSLAENILGPLFGLMFIGVFFLSINLIHKKVHDIGREGMVLTLGKVISSEKTYIRINSQRILKLVVEIELADGSLVQSIVKAKQHPLKPKFTQGMYIPIRYNANNPSNIKVDYNVSKKNKLRMYNEMLEKSNKK